MTSFFFIRFGNGFVQKAFIISSSFSEKLSDEALKQTAETSVESYILCEDLSYIKKPKLCSIQVHAVSYSVSLFKQLEMFRGWLKSTFCKLSHLIPFL